MHIVEKNKKIILLKTKLNFNLKNLHQIMPKSNYFRVMSQFPKQKPNFFTRVLRPQRITPVSVGIPETKKSQNLCFVWTYFRISIHYWSLYGRRVKYRAILLVWVARISKKKLIKVVSVDTWLLTSIHQKSRWNGFGNRHKYIPKNAL